VAKLQQPVVQVLLVGRPRRTALLGAPRNRENEVASWWRNATGSELRRWQPAEPIDDGRLARYSLAPLPPAST